jgi:hypothetical protein
MSSVVLYVCETCPLTVMAMNVCRVREQDSEEAVQAKPKYQNVEGNCVTKDPLDEIVAVRQHELCITEQVISRNTTFISRPEEFLRADAGTLHDKGWQVPSTNFQIYRALINTTITIEHVFEFIEKQRYRKFFCQSLYNQAARLSDAWICASLF